jgi:hypothetical protein
MAIRIRVVNGVTVALCAVEADPMPGDVYLDDAQHYALAAKFSRDWRGHPEVEYPIEWATMDTQKVRDAEEEAAKWQAEQHHRSSSATDPEAQVSLPRDTIHQ